MNERLQKTMTSVKEFWSRQSSRNKGFYIGGLAAVIVIAVIAVVLLNRKDYVTLYEGLESTEAAEIVALIEDAGYECTLKGGTITVVKGTEDAIAMALALQQYPRSNLNYTTYTSNAGMFSTQSELREYERMAQEEHFAAAITKLEGVREAIVTLALEERKNTVIEAYRKDASASVQVFLDKNVTLSSKQIEGITHLIMTGAGIKEENISIIDGNGVLLLADENAVDVVSEETKKLKFKTDLENQIREKIEAMLIPAYGEEGFTAAVNMVLNFDAKVSETTTYTPSTNDERGMLSHTDAEQASGYADTNGGVVGVETNADDTYPTGNTNGNGQWTENSVSNTYLVNTYKEQVEKSGYVIDGLSIALVIYTDYLPETTRTDLIKMVATTGTINPDVANDVVSVTNLAKAADIGGEEEAKYLFGLTMKQLLIMGGVLLALLIILIIVLVSLSSRNKKKRVHFEKTLLEQHAPPEDEPLVDRFFSFNDSGSLTPDVPSLIPGDNDPETKEAIIRRELSEFAQHSPEIVAQLLRNWMKDDE